MVGFRVSAGSGRGVVFGWASGCLRLEDRIESKIRGEDGKKGVINDNFLGNLTFLMHAVIF